MCSEIFPRFALKNNLPHLDFCTVPRTGALVIALDILGPNMNAAASSANGNASGNNGGFDAQGIVSSVAPPSSQFTKLIDVTIAYPEGNPLDLIAIFTGYRRPCKTHVHYRIYDIKDVSSWTLVQFFWQIVYVTRSHTVSYTHLTLPTTPYV